MSLGLIQWRHSMRRQPRNFENMTLVARRREHFRKFWRHFRLLNSLQKEVFLYTLKNSLACCRRCRHSIEPCALTCPFKHSDLIECQLRTPTRSRIYELLELGASSSLNLFQSLITNQDLIRLREDMWPNHKTLRKDWWCRAFATAINRQCPTCNRLWTTEQFPPSLTQCLTCTRVGNKKK